ncbi:DUF4230 domain-containing protein [Butyrivibrio sp. M55]|uniref:DUF4230 domain-containing protein n=1 Tax=Butyrivibrio sp. M55 TaxID=1855323 RepID=UPI0008DF1A9B|nr:DUF4230 domain-containing protein [Butyrivibrio sp. M55]SFU58617.1 Protein of unknown function [Butyrivibrio sp. M55]
MEFFKKNKNYLYIVVILIAVITMLVLLTDYKKNANSEPSLADIAATESTVKKSPAKVIVTVNTETIREGIANMGTLITQEYYFTQVEKYTKEKTIMKFITSSSEFLYSYDGAVTAGVDFEKIAISKDDDAKTITIDIPDSEIFSVNIDKDTFKIYSEKDSLWNPLKLEDYNTSLAKFEAAAKEKALANGILEKSDAQAKTIIENFVNSLPEASKYQIEIK